MASRRISPRVLALILFTLIFSSIHDLPAQQLKELHIAAASDLQAIFPQIATAYERATGIKLIPSFGSTATLTEQLINGSPQDLFLAADFAHPEDLIAHNLADDKSPTVYARGVLVLWARKDSPAQPLSLDSLTKPAVQKIAVANDRHAPYGLAATSAIRGLHLTAALASKLVVGENISQTAQFAESGNAQAALISLTIANSQHFRDLGTFVRFDTRTYAPIQQTAIVLKSSQHKSEAHDFIHWLTSPAIQSNLKPLGLDPVN